MEDDFDYQILKMTDEFYRRYPNPPFREIMAKQKRAYNCLLLQTHYDYFICIPYRSEIRHNNAFLFKGSKRAKLHRSGLDYSKIIIVKDPSYIEEKDTIIDQDEYRETIRNLSQIKDEATRYVDDYVHICIGKIALSQKEYRRRYHYSTLRYFHKELGL